MKYLTFVKFLTVICITRTSSLAAEDGEFVVSVDQINVQSYNPDLEAGTYLVTPDTGSLGRWKFSAGTSLSYGDRPLAILDSDTGAEVNVGYIMTGVLFGAVGVTDRLSVGYSVPYSRVSGFLKISEDAEKNVLDGSGVGDLVSAIKWQLSPPQKRRPGLSLMSGVSYPLSKNKPFISESGLTVRGSISTELRLHRFQSAMAVGYQFRPTVHILDTVITDSLEYGLALNVPLIQSLSVVADLHGHMNSLLALRSSDEDYSWASVRPAPLELLVGLRGASIGGLYVQIGGGIAIVDDPGAPGYRIFINTGYRMPPENDPDNDGIRLRADQCPDLPETINGVQDSDGCPERDSDNDSLVDFIDACPNQAEDFDGFRDEDGCPELDNDEDGLIDSRDQCPVEPEDKNGLEDGDGCPEIDSDSDGISDRKDHCPYDAEDANGIDDDDGCPELISGGQRAVFDSDQDGVEDRLDRCPMIPETTNAYEDLDGCPETDRDKDGFPDAIDRCPDAAEDADRTHDDDGCPE